MKRELKVLKEKAGFNRSIRVSRLIPMKRELKAFDSQGAGPGGAVSRLIPMKRELKDGSDTHSALRTLGFKTDPDEKGTERGLCSP